MHIPVQHTTHTIHLIGFDWIYNIYYVKNILAMYGLYYTFQI
jgi:hypothetical protein